MFEVSRALPNGLEDLQTMFSALRRVQTFNEKSSMQVLLDLAKKCLPKKAKQRLKRRLEEYDINYYNTNRVVLYKECKKFLRGLNPEDKTALEISGGDNVFWQSIGFKSYRTTQYPEFDICEGGLNEQFDIIIADQVFEHLLWPYRAARNAYAMLKPGGHLIIATPFLVRRHDVPTDCTRWTDVGMKYFLAEAGFSLERVQTGAWGNKACVKANLTAWTNPSPFTSFKNEPNFPVMVWAFAQREE